MAAPPRIVIIGGGFGGLVAARDLRKADVEVTLIDRRNFHLFQPLLYQVATGQLSPANIASPLRSILKRQKNTRVLLGEVRQVDVAAGEVVLGDERIGYDYLIVATGARHHYFGRDDWEKRAPGLKTIEDALAIRRRVLSAFEVAERESDLEDRKAWLTFVVVGAGPTGVELAGAIAELSQHTLKRDFRNINPGDARIVLVEGAERVLPPFDEQLSAAAAAALERLSVTVRTNAMVTDIGPESVTLRQGDTTETIRTHTVMWAAGVLGSSLGRVLAEAVGAELDRAGRVKVAPDLSLPGHNNIFVVGDLAHYDHQTGSPLPGVAQVAMQQGAYAAKLIVRKLRGQPTPAFHYHDRGSLAMIGRSMAVADLGKFKFKGRFAWLIWLFVHLVNLVEFQNRLLVMMQWGWNYFTRGRSSRLITEEEEGWTPIPKDMHPADQCGAEQGDDEGSPR